MGYAVGPDWRKEKNSKYYMKLALNARNSLIFEMLGNPREIVP